MSQDFKINELVGAILNLNSGGVIVEAYDITANTATTITVNGTFISASNEYEYDIVRLLFLGAANGPWRRVYTHQIRWGKGATDGFQTILWKEIADQQVEMEGLSLMNFAGFKQTVTTALGAGFTLTPVTSYHTLAGTAARTSDGTTAINDGVKEGQILVLEGTDDSNTITIQDGANTQLAGGADAVLGAGDTVTLIWNGANWVELSRSNN